MRPSTIAKIVAVLLLVLVVALIGAGKSLKSDVYNSFLAERVKAATGLDLSFAGPTKLKLGPSPVLSFTGVTLSKTGGKDKDLFYIDRVEARIALVPLALRQMRVESVTLFRPVMYWENLAALTSGKALDLSDSPSGAPLTRLGLADVRIEDGILRWHGNTIRVSKAVFQQEGNAGGPLTLLLNGQWQENRFDLNGTFGPLSALSGVKPYPIQIKGSTGSANVTLRGTLAPPQAAKGTELEVRAQGEELADLLHLRPGMAPSQPLGPFKLAARVTDAAGPIGLAELDTVIGRRESLLITAKGQVADIVGQSGVDLTLGVEAAQLGTATRVLDLDLPNAGPVKLSGRLTNIENGWRITGLKSSLGKSDLAGEISLVQSPRPRLYGRLSSTSLNLGDFSLPPPRGGTSTSSSQPQRPAIPIDDGRIISADVLPLDLIKTMDANLSLAASTLSLGSHVLSDATAELRMAGGRLAVESLLGRSGEGRVSGEVKLDTTAKTPALALRLNGSGVDSASLTGGAVTAGKADFSLDLKAQGHNLRAMAGSAEGGLSVTLGDMSLSKNAVGAFTTRLTGEIAPLTEGGMETRFRCLAARLPVKAGLVNLDRGVGVETAGSGSMAFGRIDLRTETLDVSVVRRTAPPLSIRGTLGAPIITVENAGKARADGAPCRTVQTRRLSP
jgi:uncharacterized protein involved in outer membrane biogenesis